MSNHHTQKSINLHHSQVEAGRERLQRRQDERLDGYLKRWAEARYRQLAIAVCVVICFGYSMIAMAVYLGFIL